MCPVVPSGGVWYELSPGVKPGQEEESPRWEGGQLSQGSCFSFCAEVSRRVEELAPTKKVLFGVLQQQQVGVPDRDLSPSGCHNEGAQVWGPGDHPRGPGLGHQDFEAQ